MEQIYFYYTGLLLFCIGTHYLLFTKEPGFHYEKVKKVRFRLRPNREKMDKRKCTSEHLFGTIKRWHDAGYFLMKRMRKVAGEFALFGAAYNLSRTENMFTFEELMAKAGRKAA